MRLPTERTDKRQSFPFPADRERIFETPPTLIWVPHPDGEAHKYTVTVWDGGGRVKFSCYFRKIFVICVYNSLARI